MKVTVIIAASLLLFSVLPLQGQKRVTEKNAAVEKLAGGFTFTEGPACDAEGSVYFTDQPNNRILKWTEKDGVKEFLSGSGRSNGMYFGNDGYLYTCADEENEIWKISASGNHRVILKPPKEALFNGPNDLWCDKNGGIWFTDPYYARPWWSHKTKPRNIQGIYYLAPADSVAVLVSDQLKQPNGIIGSPDGKRLYVADIGDNKTYRFDIVPEGRLVNKVLFCNLGSDGMTIDKNENLYLTGNGVTVFSKEGIKLINIQVPEKWTANVCFGGPQKEYLFITATEGFYRIKMRVRGVPGFGK
jgi:gluconolactonase